MRASFPTLLERYAIELRQYIDAPRLTPNHPYSAVFKQFLDFGSGAPQSELDECRSKFLRVAG